MCSRIFGVIIASGSRFNDDAGKESCVQFSHFLHKSSPDLVPLADDARPLVGSQRIGDLFELALRRGPAALR